MRSVTLDTLAHAHDVASTYDGNLTLRQLYYQLVARGLIENSQKSYKRVGSIVANARLSGDFPLEWLLDRGRTVHEASSVDNRTHVMTAFAEAQKAVQSFPFWYLNRGRWFQQPTQVSVWVEKEALSGVFEEPCEELGVGWFACKGYPSISSLYEWLKRAREIEDAMPGEVYEHRILYFGDHDPDGWQIPRSARDTLLDIRGVMADPPYCDITFTRIALNIDQITTYSPPPFPAKLTSPRYQGYVDEHGTQDAWELDALQPPVLTRLITDSVSEYFDEDIHEQNCALVDERREELRFSMRAQPERLMERL